jgi:hypothetical protein
MVWDKQDSGGIFPGLRWWQKRGLRHDKDASYVITAGEIMSHGEFQLLGRLPLGHRPLEPRSLLSRSATHL